MRVAIIGVGGIGGVLAATLTRAGVDVTPVAGNADVASQIRQRGLTVRELDGSEWSAMPRVAPVLQLDATMGPFDVGIVATQNTTLERALQDLLPHLRVDAPIVTIQNGLPEDRARELVGDRVLGCVVGWGASMVEPGVYRRTSKGGLQIGRPAASALDERVANQVAVLLEAASPTTVVPDLAGVRWSKLAINCVTTTLGAIGGLPLGRLLSHRPIRRIALEVFAEVAAVAAAAGIKVLPVGGTLDIDRIAITDAERGQLIGSPSLAYKHSILLAVGFKYRRMRSSMLYALERGRPPEIDFLNGEIVRRGALLGVPTPMNEALVAEVQRLVRKETTSSLSLLRALYEDVVVGRKKAA